MSALLIADEFILLAMYARNDGWYLRPDGVPQVPDYVGPGVSVALLADLAVMGAISADGGRLAVTGGPVPGAAVPGDTELREIAAQIAGHPGHRPAAWWAARLAATSPELRRLHAMRRRHCILEYEAKPRHQGRPTAVPAWFITEDDSLTASVIRRLGEALRTGSADERTTTLLAVVHACGVHRAYFRDRSDLEREQQIRPVVHQHWTWQAAKRSLQAAGATPATYDPRVGLRA